MRILLTLVCAAVIAEVPSDDESVEDSDPDPSEVPCIHAIVCADNARYVCTDSAQSIINMNAKPTIHDRYTHTDSIPFPRVLVQEALYIALMDDPAGKKGGTATMSKVWKMTEKFNMAFFNFNDYEHSGMPATPEGNPMLWFVNTGWFMVRGKIPPDALIRNFDKLRLWSAKCEFNIVPQKVVIKESQTLGEVMKFLTYDPSAAAAAQEDDLDLE